MPIITEQDFLNLIAAGTQENLNLEFKRCDALQNNDPKKDELSKDVSAFANAAGGELIYGIIEDANLPTAIDVGFDAIGPIKREWIEQVISSRIQPRIQGIIIRPIALSGANAGRFAFVLDIPQSHTAHQARDKKYYKRRNFTVEPMEDYEIRDVLNRAKTPLLVPYIKASRAAGDGDEADYGLSVRLHNEGDVSARTIRLELGVPNDLIIDNGSGQAGFTDGRNRHEGRNYDERTYIYQKETVIFPQQEILLGNWGIVLPSLRVNARKHQRGMEQRLEIRWTIYADDMRRQEGQLTLFPDLLDF